MYIWSTTQTERVKVRATLRDICSVVLWVLKTRHRYEQNFTSYSSLSTHLRYENQNKIFHSISLFSFQSLNLFLVIADNTIHTAIIIHHNNNNNNKVSTIKLHKDGWIMEWIWTIPILIKALKIIGIITWIGIKGIVNQNGITIRRQPLDLPFFRSFSLAYYVCWSFK